MLTSELLRRFSPSAKVEIVSGLVDGWPKIYAAGIETPRRLQHFMAEIATETGGLRLLEENLNYSAERLRVVWPKRFPNLAAASRRPGASGAPAEALVMTRILAVALSCSLLGACSTLPQPGRMSAVIQPAWGPDKPASAPLPPPRPVTRANATVARVSAELARYCGLTQAAVAAVGFFASPKVQMATDYASVVLATVCASPPTDVRTALETVGRAYVAVSEAKE